MMWSSIYRMAGENALSFPVPHGLIAIRERGEPMPSSYL